MERWTEVGREIMQGVDEGCGKLDRSILLIHDRVLFRQADSMSSVSRGSDLELAQALEDFLLVHADRLGGVLLEDLWPDNVLTKFRRRLCSGVVVYRHTALPYLGCVSADTDAAARLVIDYAKKMRFERLTILPGVRGYMPSEEMVAALRRAASSRFPRPRVFAMHAAPGRRDFLADLRKQRKRTLVVGIEDNIAAAALESIREMGIDMPEQVGLVSTMGTRIASDRSITIIGANFRRIGEEAAVIAASGQPKQIAIPPVFLPGCTA